MWRTLLASACALALGITVIYQTTAGFRAFTAETLRRVAVAESPRPVPPLSLQLQDGSHARLDDLQGHVVVATFMYAHCRTVCVVAGAQLARLRDRLVDDSGKHDVHFLSISFDPDRDSPAQLSKYADRYDARLDHWWVARPDQTVQDLLDWFGVVVIPVGGGMYLHNTAMYLIDKQGQLVGIHDYQDTETVVQEIRKRL